MVFSLRPSPDLFLSSEQDIFDSPRTLTAMRHSPSPLWSLACLLLVGVLSLQGMPSLQVRVNKNVLALQEPLQLTVILSDDADTLQSPPERFPLPADLPFQVLRQDPPSQSSNVSTQWINGRMTQSQQSSVSYSFLVMPLQEGEFTIPSLILEYQGKTLKSEPITLRVTREPAENQRGMVYRQRLSRERIVPGVPVTLTLELIVPRDVSLRQVAPSLDLDALQKDFTISQPSMANGQILWNQESLVQNGVPCLRIFLDISLTPLHPGSYAIPAGVMEVLYSEEDRQRGRDPFLDFLDFPDPFSSRPARKILASQPLTLEVEDFPQGGRPEGFSGLLGPLQVTASVDQTSPRVGDPIQLTLRLQGDSLTPQATLPPWEKALEALPTFKCFGNDPCLPEEDGSLLIQRTLRPLQAGTLEIPAIAIPYYDPDLGQYGMAASEPILLQVQKSEEVALPTGSAVPAPKPKSTPPAPGNPSPGMAMPEETTTPPLALQRSTILWGILLPAALLLLGFLLRGGLLLRKRRLASVAHRLRKAREALMGRLEALEAEGSPQASAQAARAWEEYLCQRFSLLSPVTAQALEEAAARESLPQETRNALQALLTHSDAAQYSLSATPFPPLKEEILAILPKL